jgi:hypothetical protein
MRHTKVASGVGVVKLQAKYDADHGIIGEAEIDSDPLERMTFGTIFEGDWVRFNEARLKIAAPTPVASVCSKV